MSQEGMRAEWEALNKTTAGITQPETPPETPEAEAPVEHVEEAPAENQQVGKTPEPTRQEREVEDTNWRRLREQNRELEMKLAEMENYIKQPPKKEQPEEVIESFDLKDDEITEGRHLKALRKEVSRLNEAVAKSNAEREKLAAEARLRAEYPDIFKVVTDENLKELAKLKPAVARTIMTSTDQYAQYATAYDLIKTYGIGKEDPYADNKERAQKNMAKPKTSALVAPRQGESTLAEADRFSRGLTPELKDQLLREMNEAIDNR